MTLELQAIAFNHDPASASADAINLRQDQFRPVGTPEWRRGTPALPVAYAAGALTAPVAVAVAVSRTDPTLERAEIRAVAGSSDPPPWFLAGVLGASWPQWVALAPWLGDVWRSTNALPSVLGGVAPTSVEFADGTAGAVVLAELAGERLRTAAVGSHVARWRWEWRPEPRGEWRYLADTEHRVFTLLDVPTSPWHQDPHSPDNVALPWSAVLEHACVWATGATDADDAAARITAAVYALGGEVLAYDCPGGGFTHYTNVGVDDSFDCAAFLDRLAGGFGRGFWVNCVDCATIVSTFANSVGCDLWQSGMFGAAPFALNPAIAIGFDDDTWRTPCGWPTFGYHETAWKGECTAEDAVFDACVQLDVLGDASRAPHVPGLPVSVPFGRPGDGTYLDRLVAPVGRQFCTPQPAFTRRRRPLMGRFPIVRPTADIPLDVVSERFGFESWRGQVRGQRRLFVWRFRLNGDELPGWRPFRVEPAAAPTPVLPFTAAEGSGRVAMRAVRSYWQELGGDAVLEVVVYECASQEAAHEYMLELLGRAEAPLYRAHEDIDLGDVAFASTSDSAAFFARGNLVLTMRNAERGLISARGPARSLDQHLSTPAPAVASSLLAGRVRAEKRALPLGTSLPLDLDGLDVEDDTMVKVFSNVGAVSLEGALPSYTAVSPGPDRVELYAQRLERGVVRRRFDIGVTEESP